MKAHYKKQGRATLNGDGRESKLSPAARRRANRNERHNTRNVLRQYEA